MSEATLSDYLGPAPGHWDVVPFNQAFDDETSGNPSIKQSDYLDEGVLAVVDQGQDAIGGYTDDPEMACSADLPCIVFGDHTRAFKYVDHPFAIGAQGTRVLVPKGTLQPRFAYHYLRQLRLPDSGYSRHYKFLKREAVPVPPPEEQEQITAALDRAEAARAKQRRALARLDALLAAVFDEMFGDPVTNPKGWSSAVVNDVAEVQGGLQLSQKKRQAYPLEVPYLRVANVYRDRLDLREIKSLRATEREVERTTLELGDVLIVEGHGNPDEIGRCAVWDGSVTHCVHQNHLIRVRADREQIVPVYLSAYLNSAGGRRQMFRNSKTTSGLNTITTGNIKKTNLLVPPLRDQRRYEAVVDHIGKVRQRLAKQGARLDALYAALAARAFRGELALAEPA